MTLKQKKVRVTALAGAALLTASLGATYIISNGQIVHADKAEMADLPKGQTIVGTKIAGKYGFSPRIMNGITQVYAFGGSSSDWATSSKAIRNVNHPMYCFKLEDNETKKGKVGVYYSNCGVDPVTGKTVDVKITLNDWHLKTWIKDGSGKKIPTKKAYAAFGVNKFEVWTPGQGGLAYRIDFIDHDTGKPLKLSFSQAVNDVDGNQWVGLILLRWVATSTFILMLINIMINRLLVVLLTQRRIKVLTPPLFLMQIISICSGIMALQLAKMLYLVKMN